ncbi:hypothetical protein EOE67_09520 [Rheinheimera riviphila]|uniref:Alginate export domain-containing protein n=1 Tax=Rheinheimera riviphila TaxID=1834037 RepID=A0A437QT79_9GAMM|nr:alginate export family protein [Rheinheimera riviphila]RVU37700.1 hypothetical protein EOE67_09520 [Rheinheimera riviphila]
MKSCSLLLLTTLPYCGLTLAADKPVTTTQTAGDQATISQALAKSTLQANFRYRLETVDQDPVVNGTPLKNALASTLRSRLTLTTGSWLNTKALLELDNVSSLGGETYNSTVNGNSSYAVVPDPTATDLNQAALLISPFASSQLTIGRQRVNLQNQRFIGSVGWRQNEQTFDGVRLQQKLFTTADGGSFSADLASLHNANRIFGPDACCNASAAADLHGRFQLATVQWQLNPANTTAIFRYDLDFDTLSARDSVTQGLDYSGQLAVFQPLKWQIALARQQDAHQAPMQYQHHYHRLDLSYSWQHFTLKLAQERLAGDGNSAFQTPFATLHAFQGFADLFLTTPNSGVRDHALELMFPLQGVKLATSFHRYDSDSSSFKLGSEINLTAAYDIQPQLNLLLKLAQYQADSFGADTRKVWLMASYSL